MPAVFTLTMAASPFTVTSWLDSPTWSVISTVALCPTANSTPVCTSSVKPGFAPRTSYSPTGSEKNW